MNNIINIINKEKKNLTISVLLILFSKSLFLTIPILFGKIIDSINIDNNKTLELIILTFFLSLFYSIISPFISRKITFTVQIIIRNFSLLLVTIIFKKNYSFFESKKVGTLIKQVERGVLAYEKLFNFIVFLCIPNVIGIFIISSYLLYISNVYIVLFLTIWSFFSVKLISYIIRVRRKYIGKVNDTEDSLSDYFIELFLAGRTIKFFNILNSASKKLRENYNSYALNTTQLAFISTILSSLQFLLSNFSGCIVMLIGIFLIHNNDLSLGDFVVIYSFSSIFMGSIVGITEAYKEYDQFKVDKYRLDEICLEKEFRCKVKLNNEKNTLNNYNLRINKFVYKINENKSIFNNKILEINFKEKIAIVGETGAGKSTLLKILTGMIHTNNTIFIGNKDICHMDESEIALYISLYFQFPDFFSGDFERAVFLDSMSIRKYDISNELSLLGLENFKNILFNSDYINMNNFSGGEKKRLDILRSHFSHSPIIIYDEPTSSLDEITSKLVWDYIFNTNKNKTIICVTHDLSYIDKFDIVITIKEGGIYFNRA